MTGEEAARAAYAAGFRGEALIHAVAIAKRESGWNSGAYNGNGLDNSVGLMQINMINVPGGEQLGTNRVSEMNRVLGTNFGSVEEAKAALADPALNMRYAYYISGGGQDWSQWSTETGIETGQDLPDAARIVSSAGLPAGEGNAPQGGWGFNAADSDNQQVPAGTGGATVATPDPYAADRAAALKKLIELQARGPLPNAEDGTIGVIEQDIFNKEFTRAKQLYDIYAALAPPDPKAQNPNVSTTTSTSTLNPNDAAQANYSNALSRAGLDISYDNANLSRATADIDRFLSGQQESRARANQIQSAQETLIKYGAPQGKTSFSLADLGAGFASRAGDMGIDPGAGFINYSGQTYLDPAGLMAQYDQSLGVTGQIPNIPLGTANPGNFPGPTSFQPQPTTSTQTSNQQYQYPQAAVGMPGAGAGAPTIPIGWGGPSGANDPAGVGGGSVLPPGAGLGYGQF